MPVPPKTPPIRPIRPAAAPPAPARVPTSTPARDPLPAAKGATGDGAPADLLKPEQVARRLGVNTKSLERWRGAGTGPAVVRINHKTLRYRLEDVEAYIASRLRTSTAEK